MSTPPNQSSTEAKIDIDIVGLLRRRWLHLVVGTVLGIAIAVLYQFSAKPLYESKIEILIGQRSSELATSGTVSSAYASGDSIQDDQLATHIKLFTSRRIVEDAVKRGNLADVESIAEVVANNGNPVDLILKNLEVDRGGNGAARNAMIISAAFRDYAPQDAARVLAALYESYRDYVESHSRDSSGEAATLIEDAQKTHEIELVAAESAYREFIESVPILLDGEKVRDVHKERLAKLEEELTEVRRILAGNESRLEIIESFLEENANAVNRFDHLALLSENEVERLKLFLDMSRGASQSEAFQAQQPIRQEVAKAQYNRLLDLLQKERTLAEEFGKGHPLVESTRQEIEVIQHFIESNAPEKAVQKGDTMDPEEMLATYTSLLKNDITELKKREKLLLKHADDELRLAKGVESDFLRGAAMKARLTRAQTRYDEVIRRLHELNLAGSYAGFSTDLLASPEIAKSPAWPVFPIVMLGGLFFGLVLGCTTGILAELVDTSFRDASDLEKTLKAPAIAHVPRFDVAKLGREATLDSEITPTVVAFHNPQAVESEIYRVARTSLIIRSREAGKKVYMMTSPHPGDGKSTTISNLAVSLAQTGKRVLLIDADMRRPVIAKMFGLNDGPGLTDTLIHDVTLTEATQHTEVANLDILTHGSRTSEPAELLESADFSRLLTQCRQEYDYVLIDAPPLLAVADPSIIAPLVDSLVLTIRVRKNCRRPIERCAQMLKELEITPSALVVNSSQKSDGKSFGYSNTHSYETYGYIGYYDEYKISGGNGSPSSQRNHRSSKETKFSKQPA
ncbi:polysaccharide biosynthesis tyrosine autokinase [Novipirellula sp. SH528]|uniref:polysaccharide biosynthesis tyrosine autokinase n=1 Tax=Novipirellula sp. SH528 TaxID=3454466 RepID=UPI003F9F52D8